MGNDPAELSGAVALVTGGATGLGRAIAERFAGAGASVVITGRTEETLRSTADEIGASGGTCHPVVADVSREADVRALFEETASHFGDVGIVVNNAGVAGAVGPIWELPLAAFTETIATNITGMWLCCREAARTMVPRRGGHIVNIGSITGKRPLANRSPYASSKMAVVGLTRALALELGPYGVRVNVISPGAVSTARLTELAARQGKSPEELTQEYSDLTALGRLSSPEDIAEAALFLSTERSRNITGVDLTVDGGVWLA